VLAGLACVAAGLVGAGEAEVGAGLLIPFANPGRCLQSGGMLGPGTIGAPGGEKQFTQAI
jgi:hypothetical protein